MITMLQEDSLAGSSTAALDRRLVTGIVLDTLTRSFAGVGLVVIALPFTAAALGQDQKATVLGILVGMGAIVGAVGGVMFGMWSDRCASRFGMRRPFIGGGMALSVVGMAILAVAPNVAALYCGYALYALGSAAQSGGVMALVPDHIPAHHRGRVMGYKAVSMAAAGLLASLTLPRILENQFLLYSVQAVIVVPGTLFLLAVLRDRRLPAQDSPGRLTARELLNQFRISPTEIPDFSWAWISRAVITLGSTLGSTFGMYVLIDQLKVSSADLPNLVSATGVISLVMVLLGSIVGPYISDRFNVRKAVIVAGSLMMTAGVLTCGFAPSIWIYLPGLAITAFGTGIWMPVSQALLIDVLPGEGRESGKYTGIMNLSDGVPRWLGPTMAPAVLGIGAVVGLANYTALYVLAAILFMLGSILVVRVKSHR